MNWTDGLSTRAANALIRNGYDGPLRVAEDMTAGAIRHRSGRSLSATRPGLGAKSIEEVRRWLEKKGHLHV